MVKARNIQQKFYKMRLKKGDTVIVRIGKYKGTTGKILAVHPFENKVTVEGINVVKKHVKPNRQFPQGSINEVTKPIDVSKVGYFDQTTKSASRISYKISPEGKTRMAAKSAKEIK